MEDYQHALKSLKSHLKVANRLRIHINEKGIAERFPQLSPPQIVVFGDQSVGKSSLLKRLTGVPTPTGTGPVTRCPIVITTNRTNGEKGAWSATVGWSHAKTLPTTCDTPAALCKQLAVLMEDVHSQTPEGEDTEDDADMAVVADTGMLRTDVEIVVTVNSPDVEDLTLVDLPGLVRNSLTEEGLRMVTDVPALYERYLKQPHTMALAVVDADADVEQWAVHGIVRKADPKGERSALVLTKADKLVSEATADERMQSVLHIVSDACDGIGIGASIVMCREGTDDEAEAAFFKQHAAFEELPPDRVGTAALQKRLSSLLARRIQEALPKLKAEATAKLESVLEEIEKLPPAPPTEIAEQRRALCDAASRVRDELNGAVGDARPDSELHQKRNFASSTLSNTLRTDVNRPVNMDETRTLRLKTTCTVKPPSGNLHFASTVNVTVQIEFDVEDDGVKVKHVEAASQEDRSRPLEVGDNVEWCGRSDTYMTRIKKLKKSDISTENGEETKRKLLASKSVYIQSDGKKVNHTMRYFEDDGERVELSVYSCTAITVSSIDDGGRGDALESLKETLRKHRGTSLPGMVGPSTFRTIVRPYLEAWRAPSEVAAHEASMGCLLTATHALDAATKELPGSVRRHLETCIAPVRDRCEATLRNEVHTTLELEIDCFGTENHYFMDTVKKIRSGRLAATVSKFTDCVDKETGKPCISPELLMLVIKHHNVGDASNEDQEAQDVLDYVFSYWKVARKRYVDNVKQKFTRALESAVSEMEDSLRATGYQESEGVVAALFQVDERTEEKRRKLQRTAAALEGMLVAMRT